MKSVSSNNVDDHSNCLLGFSLSSQNHHEPQIETGFYQSVAAASYFNSGGIYYDENGGFYSAAAYPVMPLKSDGSLCIMEALHKQHPQVSTTPSTPKLEDFFGGATMENHHNDRDMSMALTLDNSSSSSLYNYSSQAQEQQISAQNYQYYADNCNLQASTMALAASDGMMKNWALKNYEMAACDNNNGGNDQSCGVMSAMVGYGDLHTLSLSMSSGSQSSSCVTASSQQISPSVIVADCVAVVATESKKRVADNLDQKQIVHRKSIDTFGQRTSQYRGVTRHRWTGRYEAHLWDNSCKKEGQTRKGRQVYLGGYDMEEKAARAYDMAALKYWGPSTHINFPLENYTQVIEDMKNMNRQEYVAHLRRKSSGFSRGASIYRGVTRHHQHGRWQARIGRVAGNKDLYLGTFSTQEEAAEAYDVAAIKFRGVNAVTNFDITRYDVERIMASNTLLAGEFARRNKEITPANEAANQSLISQTNNTEITLPRGNNQTESDLKMALYQRPPLNGCYKMQSFALATGNMTGTEPIQQEIRENSTKLGTNLSNASSTEGSPDKTNAPFMFSSASKFL